MNILAEQNHKSISSSNSLQNVLCGFMIISLFFGEQIKISGVPLYCYILAACIILMIYSNGLKIKISLKFNSVNLLQGFALIMILMNIVLLPFSYDKMGAQPFFSSCISALIVYVVCQNCKNKESFEFLIKFIIIGIIITCITTQIELFTGRHFITINSDYYLRMGMKNAFGFQTNINDNATVLTIGIFSIFYYIKKRAVICLAFLVWVFYLIWAIGARMSILAMIASLVAGSSILMIKNMNKRNNKVLRIFLPLLTLFFFVTILIFNEKVLSLITDDQNFISDTSRIFFIKSSLENTVLHSFFLGNGAGVTQFLIGGYSIHCLFIEVLCDNGFIPFILLVLVVFKMLFSFTAKINLQNKLYLTCFAVVFIIMSFCPSSMLRIRAVWPIFAVIWSYSKLLYV